MVLTRPPPPGRSSTTLVDSHVACSSLILVHMQHPRRVSRRVARRAAAVHGVARGGGASPNKYIWAKNTWTLTFYSSLYACTPSAASPVAPPPSMALPRASARHRPPTTLASRPRRVFIATTCPRAPSLSRRSSCRRGARRHSRRHGSADKIQPGHDHLILYFLRQHVSVHVVLRVSRRAADGVRQSCPTPVTDDNSGLTAISSISGAICTRAPPSSHISSCCGCRQRPTRRR